MRSHKTFLNDKSRIETIELLISRPESACAGESESVSTVSPCEGQCQCQGWGCRGPVLGGGEELGLGETIPPRGEECAKNGENRKYRK